MMFLETEGGAGLGAHQICSSRNDGIASQSRFETCHLLSHLGSHFARMKLSPITLVRRIQCSAHYQIPKSTFFIFLVSNISIK